MVLKITFTLAIATFLNTDLLENKPSMVAWGFPINGMQSCLNHQDCRGENRLCHRNKTMIEGNCVCIEGFKLAHGNLIKCLNIKKNECESDEDCPNRGSCKPLGYISIMDLHIDLNLSFHGGKKKRCLSAFGNINESQLGEGSRQGPDYLDNIFNLGSPMPRHPTGHSTEEHMKFIEDAMLVLFLMCIMITLMVVHRAACRNFIQSHRNGPLRFIISLRDDQPPAYGDYNTDPSTPAITRDVMNAPVPETLQASQSETQPQSGKLEPRTETPPPTYDEALMISQANPPSPGNSSTFQPAFVALPESGLVSNRPSEGPLSYL